MHYDPTTQTRWTVKLAYWLSALLSVKLAYWLSALLSVKLAYWLSALLSVKLAYWLSALLSVKLAYWLSALLSLHHVICSLPTSRPMKVSFTVLFKFPKWHDHQLELKIATLQRTVGLPKNGVCLWGRTSCFCARHRMDVREYDTRKQCYSWTEWHISVMEQHAAI